VTLAIIELLATKDPTNADRQRELSVCHEKLGEMLLAQKDVAGALAEYRLDLAIAERVAAKDPANLGWQTDLARSQEKVGDALLAPGASAERLAHYKAALAIARRLEIAAPNDADLRSLAAELAAKVATCCDAKRIKP